MWSASVGGGGGPPPFVPTDIANLFYWVDLLDAGSYTVTAGPPDVVTSITEKVGSSTLTKASATAPLYLPTGLNGHPCMAGEVAGTRTIIGSDATILAALPANVAYTKFTVVQLGTADAAMPYFSTANSASNSLGIRRWGQSTTGAGRYTCNVTDDAAATISVDSTAATDIVAPHIVVWRSDGNAPSNTVQFKLDGGAFETAVAQNSATTLTANRYGYFARLKLTVDLYSDARIGEDLMWSRALSDTEVDDVVDYLTARWL